MCCEIIFPKSLTDSFSSEKPFEIFVLSNGIRIVHQQIDSPVAYCALMMNTGSRDESENETGAAHLVEHLFFKETHKRKTHHIFNRMENVGGELNAYTTKEDTCIHAAFLSEHYARTLELFSDIVFNHKITKKTLNLEKKVVIDEIKSYKDSPSELIFDAFEELLFPGHPLGAGTLGTEQSVKSLNETVINGFIERNYFPGQMILSSIGKISPAKLVFYAEKYFAKGPAKNKPNARIIPPAYAPFNKRIKKRNHQSHCIMGVTCAGADEKFRMMMAMLSNLLGGSGMNSRLNMSLRERNGWVYHVEASYTPYSDVGIFNIYFGTDKENIDKCIAQVYRELDKLKKQPLTNSQLKKLQQQMIGQLAVASDNPDARMLSAGKSMMMFRKIDGLYDLSARILEVKPENLSETANSVFNDLSVIVYQ